MQSPPKPSAPTLDQLAYQLAQQKEAARIPVGRPPNPPAPPRAKRPRAPRRPPQRRRPQPPQQEQEEQLFDEEAEEANPPGEEEEEEEEGEFDDFIDNTPQSSEYTYQPPPPDRLPPRSYKGRFPGARFPGGYRHQVIKAALQQGDVRRLNDLFNAKFAQFEEKMAREFEKFYMLCRANQAAEAKVVEAQEVKAPEAPLPLPREKKLVQVGASAWKWL